MNISVIIPVYNAEKYVSQAVASALQFDEVKEIILVEDQSPDNALKVCKTLEKSDVRVKLYQHADGKNHGAGASRNLGLQKATGDFIAFLDADDYYLPNRFDAEKELFQNPEVDGVYGALGVHYYSETARAQNFVLFGDRLTTVYKNHPPEEVLPGQLNMLGSFGLFSIDALTLRKKSLDEKIQPFFKTHLRLHQDTEFLFRVSFYLKLFPGILHEAVAVRGVHEDNRITKVERKKVKPSTSRVLLWREVSQWADGEKNLSPAIRKHIERMHRSWEIAHATGFEKWKMIVHALFRDYRSIRSGLYNINFRKDLF